MLRNVISFGLSRQNFAIATAHIIVLSFVALPLAGCGADGQGGPVVSSLSAPTDTSSGEGSPSDADPTATASPAGEDATATSTETETGTASAAEDFEPATIAEPTDGDEDPTISVTSTPTGATARVTWDVSSDPTISNYYVYYGKQSSGEPGSCSYEASQSVEAPPATITGLEPNTPYFFSISAFGESESPCSSEVLVVTPPAHS